MSSTKRRNSASLVFQSELDLERLSRVLRDMLFHSVNVTTRLNPTVLMLGTKGEYGEAQLAKALLESLKAKGLARDSEDGRSIPLRPTLGAPQSCAWLERVEASNVDITVVFSGREMEWQSIYADRPLRLERQRGRFRTPLMLRRLAEATRHCRKKFRAHLWDGPRTHGNADSACCSFREVRDALVEIHVPTIDAAHHLLLFDNGARRTLTRTDLAGLTEIVGTEAVRLGRQERHVGCDGGESHPCPEMAADDGSVFSEFAQAGRDGRRDEK